MHLSKLIYAADRTAASFRDALVDPARRERTVLVSLAAYLVLWTIYDTITNGSQGLHYDMTEVIAWSRDLQFRLSQAPAARRRHCLAVVRRVSSCRVVLLPVGDADADDRAVDRLAAVGGLS